MSEQPNHPSAATAGISLGANSESTGPSRRRLSPRKRARYVRLVQYVLLLLLLAVVLLLTDWTNLIEDFLAPELLAHAFTRGLPNAFLNTIVYTSGAFVLGLAAGTVLAIMKLSGAAPYRWIATAYVEFFRGLPALVVLIGIFLLPTIVPGAEIPFGTNGKVWLGLGIVGSAYIAETVRAGIQAVPVGQVEAARSLGMTSGAATRKIVLPQAFRIVLPPLTNELILLVKDSSLVFVFGLTLGSYDLTGFGRQLANSEANMTPLVVAGFCYLLITLPLSVLVRRMENRSGRTP